MSQHLSLEKGAGKLHMNLYSAYFLSSMVLIWLYIHVGICGPKGILIYLAVLVRNRALILTILVLNRVWFLHPGLELGMSF